MGIMVKQDITSYGLTTPSNKTIALRHASRWLFSQDIPSDITVKACGVSFPLHKFPLVSRSGWIRRYVNEAKGCNGLLKINFHNDIPGGAEAFELAARFCYGIELDMDETNVAMLRCVAEYLEMSDDYENRNLISHTEECLTDLLSHDDLSIILTILQTCKSLLPMADDLNIVNGCIEAGVKQAHSWRAKDAWWGEGLSELCIEFFERMVSALAMAGVGDDVVGGAIVCYAQKTLKAKSMVMEEGEKRMVVEKLVNVLPRQKNTFSVSFLFGLLKLAIELEAREECRMELERRIGWQLEQACLDDLLIPSISYASTATLFNIDVIHCIVLHFLNQGDMHDDFSDLAASPSPSSVMKVARLMDCYLAEIAPDANLTTNMFISLGELMPDYARVLDDGVYRAIDIYLKAHPALNKLERKKVCNLMDCQKLSQEACAHAAQNERLPIQVVMQVLYFEQNRLRKAINSAGKVNNGLCVEWREEAEEDEMSERMMSSETLSSGMSPLKEDYGLRKENMELKEELERMRRKVTEMEEEKKLEKKKLLNQDGKVEKVVCLKNGFLHSLSKKLGWLNPFQHNVSKDPKTTTRKSRRHSIS